MYLKYSGILVALLSASALCDTTTEETDTNNSRIVSGTVVNNTSEASHHVSLQLIAGSHHFCGGSIISSFWILSAAHCTIDIDPKTIKAVVGIVCLNSKGDEYLIERIINHNNYRAMLIRNDISLLKTEKEIVGNSAAIPLCKKDIRPLAKMRLYGFGLTSFPGNPSNELLLMDTTAIGNLECGVRLMGSLHFFPFVSFINNICVQSEKGKGACKGDSGGGLIDVENKCIGGVVSWGRPCAKGSPDIFTRVSTYLNWIQETIKTA